MLPVTHRNGILTVADFLSPGECEAYIQLAESVGFARSAMITCFAPQQRDNRGDHGRVASDDPDRADQLWQRVVDFVPSQIGSWRAAAVNPSLRFCRYDVGQHFDWHRDGSFEGPRGERSKLTFMVYLNDDFEGGATNFRDVRVVPRRGMALLFPHRLEHMGGPVTRGRKLILRTDVVYRHARDVCAAT